MNQNDRTKIRYATHLVCSVCLRVIEVMVSTGTPDPQAHGWEIHPCATSGCAGVLRVRYHYRSAQQEAEPSS